MLPKQQPIITPKIIHRKDHSISRKNIDPYALKTMYRLKKFGFEAYLVGGAVRDLLLGLRPKDYDVVTNATPDEIKKIFSNSFIIGRRFKLVHVIYKRQIIEVITFRKEPNIISDNGVIAFDNNFGDINEDSIRRDITINALYYNIKDFSIVDYSDGFRDIKKNIIKIIGDPNLRFQEDPLRILRVLRFAAKFNWNIDRETKKAIKQKKELLIHIKAPRLYEEFKKLFSKGAAYNSYLLLNKHKTLEYIFSNSELFDLKLIKNGLKLSDSRFNENKTVNIIYIIAIFLWGVIEKHIQSNNINPENVEKLKREIDKIIAEQRKILPISNNETILLKKLLAMQFKFNIQNSKNLKYILTHKYFHMSYELFNLRYSSGRVKRKLYKYWANACGK